MALPSLTVLSDATDPVCGMSVTPGGGTPADTHAGVTYHFCSEICRRKFVRAPAKFLAGARESMDAQPGVVYICPMCPGTKLDTPGACPTCGMVTEPADGVERPDPEARSLARRTIIGIILGLPLLALSMTDMIVPTRPIAGLIGEQIGLIAQAVLATIIVFWCGAPLLARGWVSIRRRSPNMFTLIAIGVIAAMAYSFTALAYNLSGVQLHGRTGVEPSRRVEIVTSSEHGLLEPFFESAAGIVVLVLIGQWLEVRARYRTGEAVRKLMTLAPPTARVILPTGREEDLPLALLDPGDRVRVRPGERVPVDGTIRGGTSSVDEAAVTGEPQRVERTVGDPVLAGTLNGLGALVVQVTKPSTDTVLAHVIHLVGVAQRSRPPLPRTADRIARWFVPIVLFLSLLTLGVWVAVGLRETGNDWGRVVEENWLTRGIVCTVGVLIIACPCAIGLAAPLAVVVGVGRGAKRGILFREAAALEKITRVDTVLFDKTGTLTLGKPKLSRIVLGVGEYETTVLEMAAAVERGSEHPLALAVVWAADDRGIEIPVATDVQAVPGLGVKGMVHGKPVAVGSMAFLRQSGVIRDFPLSDANSLRLEGYGVTAVGVGDRCVALLGVLDPVRPTAAEAVKALKDEGLRVVLVSGDDAATANAVAHKVGITEVIADTLPVGKYAVVKQLRDEGRTVAMVGDGINDAAALAAADVGIALGTGTDVAMTSAGVTLVRPELDAISSARDLGRRTVRTIRQNLWLAFGYNVLALPVAAGVLVPFGGGLISPVWAAAAMSLSSVSVILNSLRLTRA